MKIVEIPSFFTPYGGEFCLEQSKALAARGHDITILANVQLSVKRDIAAYLLTPYTRRWGVVEGIRIYRSDMRGLPLVIRPNVRRWVNIVKSMFSSYVHIYGKPDIIHAHCAKWAGYVASLLSAEYDIPFVITEHLPSMIFKTEFGDDANKAWQIPLLKKAYRVADMVIPVSAELVDDISCYFGRDYNWTEISNTIDTDFFEYHERKPLNGRKFRFCCLANYIPRKGYDVLFRAFDLLAERDKNVELYIAGFGTDSDNCHRSYSKMKHSDAIHVCGELNKTGVRNLLYESDCLVLASRSESQSLVLLEAMSTGIHVISTDCIPRSVKSLSGCTTVEIDNVVQLADAMFMKVQKHEGTSRSISSEVASLASPMAVGMKLEQLFKNIILSKNKRG